MKRLISLSIRHIPRKHLQLFGHLIARLLSIFYLGKKVMCPVCQHKYRKFLPYGRIARENALCPNCLSLERHRLLWLYLQQQTTLFSEKLRMLHIAPEYCFIERFDSIETLDYVTADLESPLAKIKMDIHQIPFDKNSFDCVLCNHVMEHVENDMLALREISRVLKPGGWAIIQVPFFEPVPEHTFEDPGITSRQQRFKIYGQEDHLRLYGKDYKQRLESCGFEVREEDFTASLPMEVVEKYGLLPETVFHCTKPQV